MKLLPVVLVVLGAAAAGAAPEPVPVARRVEGLVTDGKLQLHLDDAVRLSLESDDTRLDRLAYESAELGVDRTTGSLYDPRIGGSFVASDSTQRSTTTQEGAEQRVDTAHAGNLTMSQRLPLGTQSTLSLSGNKQSTNNQYAIVNPSYSSSFRFELRQPLWRNQLGYADRATVKRARADASAAHANLGAQLAATIERAVGRYWATVLAAEGLAVRRKSLELAEATHKKNSRMLELGALAPLEIHRSEADVASRQLDVLRGEFELRNRENELRRELGLDLDPELGRMPLVLLDTPVGGETGPADVDAVVAAALQARPELHSLERTLESRESQVRVTESGVRPMLDLVASYSLSGVGGTELDPATLAILRQTSFSGTFNQIADRSYPVYSLSLNVDLPLHNRVNHANLAAARIERERARLDLQERRQQVSLEVRQAADEVTHTLKAIELATTARDLQRKTLESEQRKYELGAGQLFFVLDAQTQLSQAELGLLSAKVDYQRALTRLDLTTGRLLEKYKISLD
jgi:outer membrane protein TolC